MTATLIDGKAIAEEIRQEIKLGVEKLVQSGGPRPGLATVLVGEDPASETYVRMKQKACKELGIDSFGHNLDASASQEEVEGLVKELNADPKVHGILVQLPLPSGLDEEAILRAISIEKDVDGFHPINIGRLAQKGRDPLFVPCTPAGCIILLQKAGAKLSGARAVVVGRSNIVGMPAALLLGQGERHRHHLPLPHPGPARRVPRSRCAHCRHWPRRDDPWGLDQTRRFRD